ncbi:MAG: choice-of-anchor D domain-containing protein [Candidatus Sulfotelmatobacter sp.]
MKSTLRSGLSAVGILTGRLFGGFVPAGVTSIGLPLTGLALAGLLFAGFGGQVASAQTFGFPASTGFTTSNVCANSATPPPSCQVLTVGSPSLPTVVTGGILQLNTANLNQHAAAWYYLPQPLSTGFTTAFQFQITSTNACFSCSFPADGMALVIQNDPAGTGALGYTGDGQNMSYGNNDVSTASGPGNAITNSLAIELDTYLNTNYSDPNGNHIAVQSCGPNNPSTLTPNSADHDYVCPNGSLAAIALQELPVGLSLSDGNSHTITVNYLPPGNCTSSCNNLVVYMDSTLILQTTLNLATQLNLTANGSAYIGLTSATGGSVENNNILSWSFSSLPLAPITINQPLQTTTTTFNYTPTLSAIADYSQSGLGSGAFTGVTMQGTVQTITTQQFTQLVQNTPFQGTTCQLQDTGGGNYGCVLTTDLCTTSTSSNPTGANCPNTGTNALINVSNTYNLDPTQKPIVNPGYIMGSDNALTCENQDNICKGLVNIFTGISGDPTTNGKTNNFNSTLIPILGVVQPSTAVTTTPALNQGWTNQSVTLNFNSTDIVPSNNTNPPSPLPAVTSINYSATGANLPSPATGTFTGTTGSIVIPNLAQGATVVTFYGSDNAGTVESTTTNSNGQVSSASPTFTVQVDTVPPTVTCTPPAPAWSAIDVVVPCTASDNAGGSGLVGPASFNVTTNVPVGTETNSATIAAVTAQDIAGNTSAPQGPFGPFEVDKKAPGINGPTISPASPVFGQSVTANYSCTDGGSGVVLCGPSGSATIPPTGNTGTLSTAVSGATGSHTVTINAQDAVGNVTTPVTVSYTVGQAAPVITWPAPAAITYGTTLSGTQLDASASVPGTFVYSPAAGTTLNAGSQTLSVTFTPTDTTDYASASASVTLQVNKAASTITWATPSAITYGTGLSATQLDATANVAGTFAYSPAAGTVLTAGSQTLSVTFTPSNPTDYSSATASVTLQVNKATPTVTWATPSAITYGTTLTAAQLDATASVPGIFVYSPGAGTLLTAGNQTLTVTFTPTDSVDYTSAAGSVSLVVNKATPILTWPTPASITYGTQLSSTQLDATANVPGTFVYTPGAGTVLAVGNQTLSVTFTPTDSVDYVSATKQVTLVVTQPAITLSPSSLNFGNVTLGGIGLLTETVTNTGSTTLKITNVSLSPGTLSTYETFPFLSLCLPNLAPGKSCDIFVSFLATNLGTHTATLLITDSATGSPQQIPITGTVIKATH